MTSASKTIYAAALMAAVSFQAEAQQRPPAGHLPFYSCGETEAMRNTLKEKYGESVRFAGTSSPIHLDEYWVNEETGTWSNTRSNIQSGHTCILTNGQNAVAVEAPKPATF